MAERLLLIDGNSIVNRAFYGVPDLTNREGLHTNAIYGFLNILLKLMDDVNPELILVAFDEKAPTFRHKMYDEYKGTRKGMPDELAEQMPVLKDVLKAMQIKIYSEAGIEADDIIGTMSREGAKAGMDVTVVSGDRDLLQLVDDRITVLHPKTKQGRTEMLTYDKTAVIRDFHVTPAQIIDLKGLMGDSSDNIPGIPGVGEKSAIRLLDQFGTLEEVIAHADEIDNTRARNCVKANPDMGTLSKKLATIKRDCKLPMKPAELGIGDMWNDEAYSLIEKLEFKSVLARFSADAGSGDIDLAQVTVSDSATELQAFFKDMSKDDILGVKCVIDDSTVSADDSGQMTLFMSDTAGSGLIAIALSAGEKKLGFFPVGEHLNEDDIRDVVYKCAGLGHIISINDLKSALDIFPELKPEQCFDTNLAAYLIRPIDKSFGEEDIAPAYLNMSIGTYAQEFGKKSLSAALKEDRDDFVRYMAGCALADAKGGEILKKELKKAGEWKLFTEIEIPLVFVLHDMESYGIRVKRDALREYGDSLKIRIDELEREIYDDAGEEFNINSPKQLGVILFEKKRLPYGKKTKTGYSTSAEVLEKLRLEDPIVEKILEYRQLTKLKSTYADGLDAFIDDDGRIRTTFHQNITATGRLSSTDPNLQNIPIRMELGRQIRKVFIPDDGYTFLDADYSQIELRVLAHMSGDERLIEAYHQDADIHRITASQVFHTPFEEVTAQQRRNAKAVNFGIVYGISGFGLSRDLDISQKQAKQYIEDYFATYPGVHKFLETLVENGKKKGFVTSMFGRRRPVPELSSKNFMQRQFGERIAMNSPIQGTAADIIKIAMIRVWKRLKAEGLKSRMILQIHDELLIETAPDEIDQVKTILSEEMTGACEMRVPLIAEVCQGDDWETAH